MSYALENSDIDKLMLGIEKTFKDFPKMQVLKSVNSIGKPTFTFTMEGVGSLSFIADDNGIYQYDKLTGDHQFMVTAGFNIFMKQYTGKDWPSGEVSPSQTDVRRLMPAHIHEQCTEIKSSHACERKKVRRFVVCVFREILG